MAMTMTRKTRYKVGLLGPICNGWASICKVSSNKKHNIL